MQLTEKEQSVIKELQTQEKSCVEKYRFYESSAKDPELQKLFHQIGDEEQEHFDSLADVLKGNVVPICRFKHPQIIKSHSDRRTKPRRDDLQI